MAVWPFNRKKSDTKVPPEVKQYYDSGHRERVGLAWLVAFLSLVATILVVAGIFFGGRWIYRKIANKDNSHSTSQTSTSDSGQSRSNTGDQEETPPSNPDDKSSQSENDKSSSSSNSDTNSDSNSSQNSSGSEQSAGGSSNQESPNQVANTGPGSNIAIFIAVTVISTLGHGIYLRRKHSS